jgi:hypothetical protein
LCPAHRQRGQGDYPSGNRESPLDITISLASPHGSKDDTPQNKKADYKRPDAIGKEAFNQVDAPPNTKLKPRATLGCA